MYWDERPISAKVWKKTRREGVGTTIGEKFDILGTKWYMGFSAEWSYRKERRMESVTELFLILEDNDKNCLDKNRSSWDRQE